LTPAFTKGDVQPPLETPFNGSTLKSAWSTTNSYAEETFFLADGSEIHRQLGDVFVRVDDKSRTVPTIFGEPSDTPLLGVTALEILGFSVNPRTRKLEPTKMVLL